MIRRRQESMYYSDDIVEEVLRSNNIVDVVGTYVHLTKKGANHFGLCPFHSEKTASFSVSERKQIFYCFGCHAGGNAATFLMKYENCSFQEALQRLAERAGMKLPEPSYDEEQKARQDKRSRLYEINKETAVYYYRLLRSPRGRRGLKYLTDRGLTPEIIKEFGLGYADGSSNDLVGHLRDKGFSDEEILEAGVAAHDEKRGLHDKFWNRVMYPIQDVNRKVIGFGGRVMGDGKPKYLNSPETDIFNKRKNLYGLHLARRSRKNRFILCEGYMDVIAMHQAGFSEAVASLGTAFTSEQAVLLRRYASDILLAYDSDGAGTQAALRNIRVLDEAGMKARVIQMQPCKDPDEFIRKFGAEAFEERIREAVNSFFFALDIERQKYDMSDPAAKTAFEQEAARRLTGFGDEIERENYLRATADRYHIPYEALRASVGRYGRVTRPSAAERTGREDSAGWQREGPARVPREGPAPAGSGRGTAASRRSAALLRNEQLLLTALSDNPALLGAAEKYIETDDFSEGIPRTCAQRLWDKLRRGAGEQAAAEVIASFTEESEQEEAAAMFSRHLEGSLEEREREKAMYEIMTAILNASVERNRTALTEGKGSLLALTAQKKRLDELKRQAGNRRNG